MPCYLKNFLNDRTAVEGDMPQNGFPIINLGRIYSVETIRLPKLWDTFGTKDSSVD